MKELKEIAGRFGVDITDEMLGQFEEYYRLLVLWNEKMNLTAITERSDVILKHFADSVLPAAKLKNGISLCDVGTGAGFPGIPLKIVRPDLKITLLDSLNKRIVFLQEACGSLGLQDVECIHMRAEDAGMGKLRETFDAVTSRAVARLNTLSEYTLPLLKIGGIFLAYKANCAEEVEEAKNAIRLLGGKLRQCEEYELKDQHRTVVVVEKISATPKRFPRGKGKEKDDPIF